MSASSSSKRRMTCSEYVTSSASTRMSVGRTTLIARMKVSRSTSRKVSGKRSRMRGSQCDQNCGLRPTRFSHRRLCDSCTPSDTPLPSVVRSSAGSTPFS